MRDFDQKSFTDSLTQLPFTTVYAINDSSDQLGMFNDLIQRELDRHAPLKRIRIARATALWLKILT